MPADTLAAPFLRGPADPDLFRRTHYGARWYLDPLPADTTWPKTDATWPSVTTIKKSWSKPFRKKLPTGDTVPLDAYWCAEYVVDHRDAIAGLDREGAMALIATCGGRTLNRAAARGTGVHTILEDLAVGRSPDPLMVDDDVRPYVDACEAFVAEAQPRWLMTEIVTISRTLEFGGTADAIIHIPDVGTCLVDWKSRSGDHGAYQEEAAQLGGYSLAEYVIVTDPDTGALERVPMPKLDLGLVVSLTKDGYRLFPIGLDDAQEAFASMRETWKCKREGEKVARKAIGQPLVLRPAAVPPMPAASPVSTEAAAAPVDLIAWVRARVGMIVAGLDGRALPLPWPLDAPTFKVADTAGRVHTVAELDLILEWCDDTEAALGLPFPDDPPTSAAEAPTPELPPEPVSVPAVALGAEPSEWVAKAMALREEYDIDPEVFKACAVLAGCGAGVTVTRTLYLTFKAVVVENAQLTGAVDPVFTTTGCRIVSSSFAVDRMVETAGNKAEALNRAKRLIARLELPIPSPRSVAQAAADPLLAALVAAGHGAQPGADTAISESDK